MTGGPSRLVHEEQTVHRRLQRFGEHESLATPVWEARDTSVRAIAAHLATLWDPPDRLEADGSQMVTQAGLPQARASVLNLIATVVDDAAADRIVGTLLDLGNRHPSRAIVLVAQPDAGERADRRAGQHPLSRRDRRRRTRLPRGGHPDRARRGGRAPVGNRRAAPHPRSAHARLVAGRPAVRRSGVRAARRDGRPGPVRLRRLRRPARRAAPAGEPPPRKRPRRPVAGSAWPGGRS